ncbi:hypothetical protein GGX14DRAFT_695029 [Mycena pura]|uniref:F-box domain-containing protein n=1 Tax=Mycena pura TaxID=153505 RepID=A0AAD6YK24_9AGAR|nr:hypothetical protein GGX14DRAFT_695029 [Mycena pura]
MFRHAPILALPVELLAYVFVLGTHAALDNHADDDDDDGYQPFNSESVQAPLAYAAVCRHWRSVALSTPALFTSLCITPELLRDHDRDHALALDLRGIAAYLKLSRAYPLDILIDARDPDWDFDDDAVYTPWFSAAHMRAAMALLLPHLARWRSLSVLTDVCAPMHAALRPLEAHLARARGAPRLESLRLMRCDAYAAYADAPNPAAADPAHTHAFLATLPATLPAPAPGPLLPRLRHLTLRGVPAAWAPLAAHLSPALRTLELAFLPAPAHPPLPALAALLRAAPRLARLVLNGAGPAPASAPGPTPGPPPHLRLPHLTALALGYTAAPGALAALRLLAGRAAPALRALELEDASDPAAFVPVDAAPLLAFVFAGLHPRAGQEQEAEEEHAEPPFPALDEVVLRHTHVAAPVPLPAPAPRRARVRRLELVGASAALLPFARAAAAEVCVRGPLVLPPARAQQRSRSGDTKPAPASALVPGPGPGPCGGGGGDAWMAHAARALLGDARGGPAPARVELHAAAHAHPGEDAHAGEWLLGATRLRVVRAAPCAGAAADGECGADDDVSMDSEGEGAAVCAWQRAHAFGATALAMLHVGA